MDGLVHIYTDGACSGNPGPGGWAYLIVKTACSSEKEDMEDLKLAEAWGAEAATTNNRMELSATIEALERVLSDPHLATGELTLYTDSQYVQRGISNWIHGWKKNGWKTASKGEVKNRDLWQKLDSLAGRLSIQWCWVKGHAGHQYNEYVDRLTQRAIKSLP